GGERTASECGAPVRRLRALARGAEAPRRVGPRALEPDAEDAARPVQIRHGRSDQIARRGAEMGGAVERAVFEVARAAKSGAGGVPTVFVPLHPAKQNGRAHGAPARVDSARGRQSKRPAAWASMV